VSCAISPDDAADSFVVRAATPADRSAALRVCVLTGNAGADATTLFPTDPEALGKRWVAPYLDLEPTLAFVLEEVATGAVCGYCLGALDTAAFAVRLQTSYLPPLRAAHPDPAKLGKPEPEWTAEERVYHELHDLAAGCVPTGLDAALYPSHLHLDLTPHAQGRGHGARMMGALLAAQRRAGSPGAFLQLHESNARARRFYEKLGFRQLHGVGETTAGGTGGAFYMGLRLA
jgi:ribosomal protein S18 acetylase RimI-like enzyme